MDLACGTCDLILAAFAEDGGIRRGIGIDKSSGMLRIGREKVTRRNLDHRIRLARGDGSRLPVASRSIDFGMISFGISNMVDPPRVLLELHRVLKPGGRLAVLEFSLPENRAFRGIYLLYFRHLLPRIGGAISGDRSAYRYLNRTVETFARGEAFTRSLEGAGFREIRTRPLSMGIATIYCGEKR